MSNVKIRKISLSGEVDTEMYRNLCAELDLLERQSRNKPIILELNSGGGDAMEAIAIAGRLRASPCPLEVHGYGQIFSAATIIFAAAPVRKMSKYAWFMVHDGEDEFEGSANQIQVELSHLKRIELQWAEMLEEFTEIPRALWVELSEQTTYMTAQECLKLKLVSELI